MRSRLHCNISVQAGQRHTADEEESLFHDSANPTQRPSRRSIVLRATIARRTICTVRSSGFTQSGLNQAD